jgi:hypothetical protein
MPVAATMVMPIRASRIGSPDTVTSQANPRGQRAIHAMPPSSGSNATSCVCRWCWKWNARIQAGGANCHTAASHLAALFHRGDANAVPWIDSCRRPNIANCDSTCAANASHHTTGLVATSISIAEPISTANCVLARTRARASLRCDSSCRTLASSAPSKRSSMP